jgi:hypothetical protein
MMPSFAFEAAKTGPVTAPSSRWYVIYHDHGPGRSLSDSIQTESND